MPFELIRNDITKMKTDAIVNAANRSLLGGGGVDGAIHRAAGPELLEECRTLGGCETGEAKITGGYLLPAKYVIHTVGPVWHGGRDGERELLAACYCHSLELAVEYNCESIAFPMISAGAYGYPNDQAMAVAVETITGFLLNHDLMVYLVVFGHESFLTGKKLFRDVQEYIDDVYAEKRLGRRSEYERRRRLLEEIQADKEYDPEFNSPVCGSICDEMAFPETKAKKPTFAGAMPDWGKLLKKTDKGFSETLLDLIDQHGMTDAECYKKANVDRKLFSKIRTNPSYQPSKPTACAFAVALELSLPETRRLLSKAGFSLNHSSKFDIILEYCISHRIYNVFEINEVLFDHDQQLLGSGMG